MSALQEIDDLLAQIRIRANDPVIERASDRISVIVQAHMEPDMTPAGFKYGLDSSRSRMFGLLQKRLGQTVSREALLNTCVHNSDTDPEIKMVDVHIHHLSKIIGQYGYTVETIRGVGYRMTSQPLQS
mgnify:CR=1 FL=1